jgi:hypothetical protein
MSTSFSNKVSILAEVYSEALWNAELKDFADINDIALPLSYLVENEFATMTDKSKPFIEETWEMLCTLLKVDATATYESGDDMLKESPVAEEVFGFQDDEDEE